MKAPPQGAVTGHPDHQLAAIASRHPAVGLAVGVVRDGRFGFFHGHGLADIASRTPVTEDTVFRIGSVTKTFTAIAVLQLCEQGLVDLDAPAGDHLRAYRLIPAKPGHRPPTVRQLLTHTAGLPQVVYPARAFQPLLGETVPYGQRVPTLAEFYRGRLHLIAEPGTRRSRPPTRRSTPWPSNGCGPPGDPDRPHQPSRLRDRLAHRQRTMGRDRQPVGPVPHPRRVQRR